MRSRPTFPLISALLLSFLVPSAALAAENGGAIDRSELNSRLKGAVFESRLRTVLRLLQGGADPNLSDDYGTTLLMLAAQRGEYKIARALLRFGADATRSDQHDVTALHLAARNCNHHSIHDLVRHGNSVNARTQHAQTPLHLATEQACALAVRELLREPGIDLEATDDYGRTAYDYAKEADVLGEDSDSIGWIAEAIAARRRREPIGATLGRR